MINAETKKITLATFKKFIKCNKNQLNIKVTFTQDEVEPSKSDKEFSKVETTNEYNEHNYGIKGVWIVSASKNYFEKYEDETFIGISVMNCCSNFTLVIKK